MNKKLYIMMLAVLFVAFTSCKKDGDTDPVSQENKTYSSNIPDTRNLDEYLTDFMDRIKAPTRSAETLSLEDGLWHLSACLNYKYSDVSVCRSQTEYDTIVTSINVNDGAVTLNEINRSLDEMSAKVCSVYSSSMLKDKNILYIIPEITDEQIRGGVAVRTVVAMSNTIDFGNYYFNNENIPLSLFDEYTIYRWNTDAIAALEYYMNIYKPESEEVPGRLYITNKVDVQCHYPDYQDRLFKTTLSSNYGLNQQEMAYYLDSYLGLLRTCNPDNYNLDYVCSEINPHNGHFPPERQLVTYHHTLDITYGIMYHSGNVPQNPAN